MQLHFHYVDPSMIGTQIEKECRTLLEQGVLRSEKCDFSEARKLFERAYEISDRHQLIDFKFHSLVQLLRYETISLNIENAKNICQQIEDLSKKLHSEDSGVAQYALGSVRIQQKKYKEAIKHFLKYLKFLKKCSYPEQETESEKYKAWARICNCLLHLDQYSRCYYISLLFVHRLEEKKSFYGTLGVFYNVLSSIEFEQGHLEQAKEWNAKAGKAYLAGHDWFYYLYSILNASHFAQEEKNFEQSKYHLDTLEIACHGAGLGYLKKRVEQERKKLEEASIDLVLDFSKSEIKTRDLGIVSMKRQYLLMGILEELAKSIDEGLSKEEIIERVWKEKYDPKKHDNKLYYNINRLRKMIEPDMRAPVYLQNFKEGYRFTPGLKVKYLKGSAPERVQEGG